MLTASQQELKHSDEKVGFFSRSPKYAVTQIKRASQTNDKKIQTLQSTSDYT